MAIDLSNEKATFEDIKAHVGHRIVAVTYGDDDNASIECEDCGMVLISADNIP